MKVFYACCGMLADMVALSIHDKTCDVIMAETRADKASMLAGHLSRHADRMWRNVEMYGWDIGGDRETILAMAHELNAILGDIEKDIERLFR